MGWCLSPLPPGSFDRVPCRCVPSGWRGSGDCCAGRRIYSRCFQGHANMLGLKSKGLPTSTTLSLLCPRKDQVALSGPLAVN